MAKERKKKKTLTTSIFSARRLRLRLQELANAIEFYEEEAERIIELPEPLLVKLDNIHSDVTTERRIHREKLREDSRASDSF